MAQLGQGPQRSNGEASPFSDQEGRPAIRRVLCGVGLASQRKRNQEGRRNGHRGGGEKAREEGGGRKEEGEISSLRQALAVSDLYLLTE